MARRLTPGEGVYPGVKVREGSSSKSKVNNISGRSFIRWSNWPEEWTRKSYMPRLLPICCWPKKVEFLTQKQQKHSTFSVFGLLNLSNYFKLWVFFSNNYRYGLCTCVNLNRYTCAQNFNTPVLISTCTTCVQILVAK